MENKIWDYMGCIMLLIALPMIIGSIMYFFGVCEGPLIMVYQVVSFASGVFFLYLAIGCGKRWFDGLF